MKQSMLARLSVDQLVERFVTLGIEQDQAELLGDTYKFKPLYRDMVSVEDELKTRKGDQRRALVRLYDHPNMQVRLNAAEATLSVAPQAARRALEAIWASRWFPQAANAGMMLKALDDGTFTSR